MGKELRLPLCEVPIDRHISYRDFVTLLQWFDATKTQSVLLHHVMRVRAAGMVGHREVKVDCCAKLDAFMA